MVKANLNFYLEPERGGHTYFVSGSAGAYRRRFDEHVVEIEDVRDRESSFTLEHNGFQYCKQAISEASFLNDDVIKETVYPLTETLIKQITGSTRVHIVEHSVRRASRDAIDQKIVEDPLYQDDGARVPDVGPARLVHIDYSSDGARDTLYGSLPEDLAETLSMTRWAIINVWRPIKPITRDPLAVCDSSTVEDEDLIPIPMEVPGRRGWDTYYVRYQPGQRWYYLNRMELDDTLVFKCFDSTPNKQDIATRVPHSSFVDSEAQNDPIRQSMELRCLVFWEDQPN